MPERQPLYRPVAAHLPAVYQEDEGSWTELRGYLAPLDGLFRAYVAQLEDVTTWLSPEARTVQPPGLAPGSAATPRHAALLDELLAWFGFAVPESGRLADPEADLERRRALLLRIARLWRRRGTPQGFVDWFSFAFAIDPPASSAADDDRPVLLEHFKYRPSGDSAGASAGGDDAHALRATLLVPRTAAFDDYRRRREAVEFVERWAPAHVLFCVCWVLPGQDWRPTSAADMRELLDRLAGYTPEEDGIHLRGDDVAATPPNRLGQGRLPGTGVRPDA